MKNYKQYFRIIGIVLFAYILFKVDWVQFFDALKNMNVAYFVFAFLLIIPLILLLTLKWRILVHSLGIKIPFREACYIYVKGLFLGLVTPGKVGELYRAKYLSDANQTPLTTSLFTVVFDRLVDLVTLVFVGGFGAILLSLTFNIDGLWILGVFFYLIIVLGILFLIKESYGKKIIKIARTLTPGPFKEKAESFFESLYQGTKNVRKGIMAKMFLLELVGYTLVIASHYLIALSLGIAIPFWYLFFVGFLIVLIVILPISVLGLGTREAGYIFFLSLLGIPSSLAVLFSLMVLIWGIFRAVPGLIFFLYDIKQKK